MRQFRDRFQLALGKTSLQQHIQDLRDANNDLIRLRKQARDLGEGRSILQKHTPPKPLSAEYGNCFKVKRASKGLYEALNSSWSAPLVSQSDLGINRHTVRLFLDAQVGKEVQMEIVITCCDHGISGHGISDQ